MSKFTFSTAGVVVLLVALALLGSCDKSQSETAPIAEPAPVVVSPPEASRPPAVKTMTIVSTQPFVLVRDFVFPPDTTSRKQAQAEGPVREDRYHPYALLLAGSGRVQAVVKMPPFRDGEIRLAELETLPAGGWQVAPRVTAFVFRSDFGSTGADRKLTLSNPGGGEGTPAVEKTMGELSAGHGHWRVVTPSQYEPDDSATVASGEVAGVAEMIARHMPSAGVIKGLREGGSDTPGYHAIYWLGKRRSMEWGFRQLSQERQLAVIDAVGPTVVRAAIQAVGPELVRRYTVDLTWEQVLSAPLLGIRDEWPDADPDRPVPRFGGLTKIQNEDIGHMLRFWARRGRPVFERIRAVVARELATAPAAPSGGMRKPASGGIRKP